jgi:uncharacterized protein (TIGR02677 family)
VPDATRLPTDMFRFTVGGRAQLYTAVLHVFGQAHERLETALGLDDVAERLEALGWFAAMPGPDLFDMLRQLREWRLLDVTQNHAGAYRTAEEYERRNLQYSLTRHGEAALAGIEHAAAVLTSTGALQTAVLDAIGDRLAELTRLLRDPASGDRRIFSALQELETHLDALRNNTKQFNGQLQRLLRADGADYATFHEVKAATVAYLQEFLVNLDLRSHQVAEAIARIDGLGVTDLHRRALAGADLPRLGDADPAPGWLAARRAKWDGLCAWFRPADGEQPRVEQLHAVAKRAIVTLLQTLDRLTESRRRASSAAGDFHELARWFALAPTDDDLHLLWSTAFGLGSARHAHLTHPDPEHVPAGTSWQDAPPVPVSALLRSSGRKERFSRTGRIRDVSELKRRRAAAVQRERAELEAAGGLLATGGPVRLSGLGPLNHTAFEFLLELIGRALAGPPDTDGTRYGLTADGRTRIALRPPEGAETTVLHTPRGALTSPDFVIHIEAVARPATSPRNEEATA